MAEEFVRTVGEMLQVVAPAFREILTADELAATTTRVIRQAAGHSILDLAIGPVLTDEDRLTDDVLLEIKTFDYQRGSWMQGHETAAEMYERFRSELQDYVATGTFDWGEWRP